jgi:hypothetical protein
VIEHENSTNYFEKTSIYIRITVETVGKIKMRFADNSYSQIKEDFLSDQMTFK